MKRVLGLAALIALCAIADLNAQPRVPRAPTPYDVARARYNALTPRRGFSVGVSYYGGLGYYSPYPVWGWGRSFGFTSINYSASVLVPPPTVIVLPPSGAVSEPEPRVPDPIIADPLVIRPRGKQEVEPPPAPEPLPPGVVAGVFRPIDPKNRVQAQQPVPPDAAVDKGMPPPPVRPMIPEADPKAEYARLLTLGRDAFTIQEYARAARRFQQAAKVLPNEPLAYFLQAQAEFAIGKYREAVVAIHEGVRLHPDWPMMRFRPLELYGPNVADYSEHLKLLEAALGRNPDDPAILFLYGYQLWFDGRQEEARPFLQRAAQLAADPEIIERFLNRKPPPPPLVVSL